jgi:5-methylcytosine-specific restriction endonuclease McrA
MVRIISPRDWEQLRLDCLQKADYPCQHCGMKDGTILESQRSKRPYIVYLHTAHHHQDMDNPIPQLLALCPSCHMKHDRQTDQSPHRTGYGKRISTQQLALTVKDAGLIMWVENDGLHWQIDSFTGVARGRPVDTQPRSTS